MNDMRHGGSPAIERLEAGLDRWGADLDAWPQEERRAAEEVITADVAARRLFETARRVDAALATLMQSDAAYAPPARPARAAYGRIARWSLAGIAASLLIGFIAGSLLPPAEDDDIGRVLIAVHDEDVEGGVI